MRPDALRGFALDYPSVAELNPRLVYGLITGYGEGPGRGTRPAYDIAAFWARSGVADLRPGPVTPRRFQRGAAWGPP